MAKIISVHSFRGGTGKSNVAANLALVYGQKGYRVGVVDTDIQSPGIHVIFNVDENMFNYSLNDYLWGQCTIDQAACEITRLAPGTNGAIFLIPSRVNAAEIARVLHDGYDVNLLSQGFSELASDLNLDILIIDTHPGLNEETLLSITLSSTLLVVMRPDYQDYQGTSLTVEVARELEVPQIRILVNKVPASFDKDQIRDMVEETYNCKVAAVLPHCEEMMALASKDVFAIAYPDHPVTAELHGVAEDLILP